MHLKRPADQIRADLGDRGNPGLGIRPAGRLRQVDQRLKW